MLAAEVLRRLRMVRVVDDPEDRDNILRHLIADLAGEIGEAAAVSFEQWCSRRWCPSEMLTLHCFLLFA